MSHSRPSTAGDSNPRYKEGQQEYAQVYRMLGDKKIGLNCEDGLGRVGVIGEGIKKGDIKKGDIVLVEIEEDNKKCNIIHVYSADESRLLEIIFPPLPPSPSPSRHVGGKSKRKRFSHRRKVTRRCRVKK